MNVYEDYKSYMNEHASLLKKLNEHNSKILICILLEIIIRGSVVFPDHRSRPFALCQKKAPLKGCFSFFTWKNTSLYTHCILS